jgi:hypothetical protein
LTFSLPRDTAATVCLQEWPIQATLFDGDVIDGPVPVLFAMHLDEAAQALAANPDKAFKDLQRIFAKFYVPENIPASAAMVQVTNPKAPEVAFPYRRKEYVLEPEPPTKRARTSAPSPTPGPSTAPETTTGRIFVNFSSATSVSIPMVT